MQKTKSKNIQPKLKIIAKESKKYKIFDLQSFDIYQVTCSNDEKDFYLCYFLEQNPGKTVVFCRYNINVQRLSHILVLLGWKPIPLYVSMEEDQRLTNIDTFNASSKKILISTHDVAQDYRFKPVEHIIHYDLPKTVEDYTNHIQKRLFSTTGVTLLLMEPKQMEAFSKIHQAFKDIPKLSVDNDCMLITKERVDLARNVMMSELRSTKENAEQTTTASFIESGEIIIT